MEKEIKDVLELFEVLDETGAGFIDEGEFELMFEGIDSWNSHNHNIMNSFLRTSRMLKHGMKPSGNVDIDLAQNTTEKVPYSIQDIYTYPHFFGKKASSRIVESRNADFINTQVVAPTNRKRTLSIMDKHGKIVSPMRGGRRSTAHKAEQIRQKNLSTLMPSKDSRLDLDGTMYNTLETRSQRKAKDDKSVDQIWTSESIVANAMSNQARSSKYKSHDRHK